MESARSMPPPPPPQSAPRSWRLRLIPIGLFGVPLFIALGALLFSPIRYIVGPVNIFNVTRGDVPRRDLVGFYAVSDDDRERASHNGIYLSGDSGMLLNEDHTLRLVGFPSFKNGESQDCHLNGTGTWKLVQNSGETRLHATLTLAARPEPGELASCGLEEVELRMIGHHAPYQLRYEWGDDDPWHALIYVRAGR
jgi:hypothetical protein